MIAADYECIWNALGKAGLLSSTWVGVALKDVPDDVWRAFYNALQDPKVEAEERDVDV